MPKYPAKAIARLALPILKELKAQEKAYEDEVNDWYSSGDGRAPNWIVVSDEYGERQVNMGGRGYSFPHCIHGTSRWTDYDNICGGCEAGESVYQRAVNDAHYAYHLFSTRLSRVNALDSGYDSLPIDIRASLITWACEPIARITK